jgi:hypothetical protein
MLAFGSVKIQESPRRSTTATSENDGRQGKDGLLSESSSAAWARECIPSVVVCDDHRRAPLTGVAGAGVSGDPPAHCSIICEFNEATPMHLDRPMHQCQIQFLDLALMHPAGQFLLNQQLQVAEHMIIALYDVPPTNLSMV